MVSRLRSTLILLPVREHRAAFPPTEAVQPFLILGKIQFQHPRENPRLPVVLIAGLPRDRLIPVRPDRCQDSGVVFALRLAQLSCPVLRHLNPLYLAGKVTLLLRVTFRSRRNSILLELPDERRNQDDPDLAVRVGVGLVEGTGVRLPVRLLLSLQLPLLGADVEPSHIPDLLPRPLGLCFLREKVAVHLSCRHPAGAIRLVVGAGRLLYGLHSDLSLIGWAEALYASLTRSFGLGVVRAYPSSSGPSWARAAASTVSPTNTARRWFTLRRLLRR